MVKTDQDGGEFKFNPEQLTDLSELAEAFIHEEADAALFTELDRDYLERLVNSAESEPPADIEIEEYEAAVEVAELILDRIDTIDY